MLWQDESGAEIGGCHALLAAEPVTVSAEQREELERLVQTRSTPQQMALRARIMVLAADGVGVRRAPRNSTCGQRRYAVGASGGGRRPKGVGARAAGRRAAARSAGDVHARAGLCDRCDDMREAGGERSAISHWSQREIADEAMRRGLIPNISQRSVGRFLKKRPTSSRIAFRYWLTPKPDPAFDAKCAESARCTKLRRPADETHRIVSIDEKTGSRPSNALRRTSPWCRQGRTARVRISPSRHSGADRRLRRHHRQGRRRDRQYSQREGLRAIFRQPARPRRARHAMGHRLRQSRHPPLRIGGPPGRTPLRHQA